MQDTRLTPDVEDAGSHPEGKRPWTKPRIKTLRVLSTRAGTVAAGVDEDNYVNDNPDNKYTPISWTIAARMSRQGRPRPHDIGPRSPRRHNIRKATTTAAMSATTARSSIHVTARPSMQRLGPLRKHRNGPLVVEVIHQ